VEKHDVLKFLRANFCLLSLLTRQAGKTLFREFTELQLQELAGPYLREKFQVRAEPPIGSEPMTYALRVKRRSSTGVHGSHPAQLVRGVRAGLVHEYPAPSRVVVSIRVSTSA
jgi:hypothetical protein